MFEIIIFVVFIFIIAILNLFIKKKKSTLNISLFKKKDRVMNDSEHALFINLKKTLGDQYYILSKVRIEDFVEVSKKGGLSFAVLSSLRGRIKSRHVDFLICNRADTSPVCAIELDGKSHENGNVKKRDEFVNKLYETIGLPIEHIHKGENFIDASNRIKERISVEDIKSS